MNLHLDLVVRLAAAVPSGVDTLVVVGAGAGEDAPAGGWSSLPARRVCLVEGDATRCAHLARACSAAPSVDVVHRVVSADGASATWYRLEPEFLDGLHPQNDLRRLFPRLVTRSSEPVSTQALVDLLEQRLPPHEAVATGHAMLLDVPRQAAALLHSLPETTLARFSLVVLVVCREDGGAGAIDLQALGDSAAALVPAGEFEESASALWSVVALRRDDARARDNQLRRLRADAERALSSRDALAQEVQQLVEALREANLRGTVADRERRVALERASAAEQRRHLLETTGHELAERIVSLEQALADQQQLVERLQQREAERAAAPPPPELPPGPPPALLRRLEEIQLSLEATVVDGDRLREALAREKGLTRRREIEATQRLEKSLADERARSTTALEQERRRIAEMTLAAEASRRTHDAALAAWRAERDALAQAGRDARDESAQLARTCARLEAELQQLRQRQTEADAALVTGSERIAELERALADGAQERDAALAELAAARSELGHLRKHARDEAALLRTRLEESRGESKLLLAQLDAAQGEAQARRQQWLDEAAAAQAEAQRHMEALGRDLTAARAEFDRQSGALRADLELALQDQRALREALQEQAAEAEAQRSHQLTVMAAADAARVRAATEMEALRRQLEDLQAHAQAQTHRLQQEEATSAAARSMEDRLRQELDAHMGHEIELRGELQAAAAREQALQHELATLRAQGGQNDQRLKRLQEEVHRAEGQLELVKELLLSDSGI